MTGGPIDSGESAQVDAAGGQNYVSFPCADADSHLMELPGWLEPYVREPARSEIRPLDMTCAGASTPADIEQSMARIARADLDTPALSRLLSTKAWAAYGGSDPAERSKALDRLGFERQLVLTTLATTQFPRSTTSIGYEFVRGHNEAIADFCSADARLLPVGYVPLDDPELATTAAEHAIAVGCVGILVPFSPPRQSPGHADFDPFWHTLGAANVPVVFHLGHGSQTIHRSFHDNGVPTTDFLGSERSMRAKDAVQAHHGVEIFLTCLILDAVFDRVPTLQVACMEFGAGWVPDWMRRLDLALKYSATEPRLATLGRRPSDYVRNQMLFCPQYDEDLGELLVACPPEILAFSSDFPHPEGSVDPVGMFEATLNGASHEVRSLFFRENFRRFFEPTRGGDPQHSSR